MKKLLTLLCEAINMANTGNILIEDDDKQKWYDPKTGTIIEL